MTHFLKHYTLKYTPLSPLHIGTGETYEPTNYVIDDGTLYEFDTGGAYSALSANDRAELSKIVSKPEAHMLKSVQKFFYDRREALKPWAVNAIPVLDGVVRLYETRVGQTANREGNGGHVLNKLEIDRTSYNPVTRQPVLFGSSVKGAIRTALLDQINKGERAYERKGLHEFQGRLLKYRDLERGKLKLELDPLRLVSLSDSSWQSASSLPTSQVFLAVNRKKSPVTNEQGQLRSAMGENLYQILECIPACYAQSFIGQLTMQQVGTGNHPALPAVDLRFSAETIAHVCNRFYLPIFNAERKLMQEREYADTDWHKTITDILSISSEKLKTGKAFLLRVGRHSGADSITVSGARNGNIKIMKGKGQPPEYADTPKTLWLAAQTKDQRTNLLPFGWLLVEIESCEDSLGDWPELAQLCASQNQDALHWAEKQAQEKTKLEDSRREAELRREQEEIERSRQIELAAQAEQQRLLKQQAEQQRLDSLSPIDQEIETFLKPIQAPEHDTRLLQELEKGSWQAADAKVVAHKVKALMEQAGKWMPDFTGDNKQKVKLKERSQKVLKYLQD